MNYVKATTRSPQGYELTVEYPLSNFDAITLDRIIYSNKRITVEKEDGTIVVYEVVRNSSSIHEPGLVRDA